MLLEILKEYRNGNKDAFNKLYTDMVLSSGDTNCKDKIKIHDKGLDCTINKTYRDFIIEGKTNKKKCIASFKGSKDDMKLIFIAELYSLFEDENFEPVNESAIFKALKYKVVSQLQAELKNLPVTKSLHMYNTDTDEEFEIIPEQLIIRPFEEEPKSGYSGVNKELLKVVKSVNIEDMCRKNAEVQINVANLIKKYYKQTDREFPTLEKMLYYYECEYGYEITKDIYSRALNNLFSLICKNSTVFKGLNINRRDYISKFDAFGNLNPTVNPVIEFYCLNSDKMLFIIDIVRQLNGYTPTEVTGDRFCNILKTDEMQEICCKYKRIIKLIDNIDKLSLEEYSDLLEAIYIMLDEYVRKQINHQLMMFIQRFGNYTFDTDIDEIYKLAIGECGCKDFWTLSLRKDGLHILRLHKTDDNNYTALKGKSDIKINCKRIYQIGKCKFILSEKNIYCRSANMELVNIHRIKNKFTGCLLSA